MKTAIDDLKTQWSGLRRDRPQLRIRDAAAELGVAEAQLLATRIGDDGVTRLEVPPSPAEAAPGQPAGPDWTVLIKEFPKLGQILALTRNEAAVHERYGAFSDEISFFHGMGQVLGEEIDLRLFLSHWRLGFAVIDETKEGPRRSFQFFDATGTAVFKVFVTPQGNAAAFDALAARHRAADQAAEQAVAASAPARPELPDAEIDRESFRAGWRAMGDTHEFFILLRKFNVSRLQALRLAPEGHARPLDLSAAQRLLESASAGKTPIMIFVGNPGCIQIHTGPVETIKPFGAEWINVLDDRFNFHLHQPRIASAWEVRKPTKDGVVTSVELFDRAGENAVLFFGRRKPGQPEDEAWRALVAALPALA
jgi:putative hemin transport protein